MDLDRHAFVQEIIQDHYAHENIEESAQDMLENLKNTWKCRNCQDGFLEINLYTKVGETWYFRHCNNCSNRTQSQHYNPDQVKGIVREFSKEILKKS
jgi:hypothetical protein